MKKDKKQEENRLRDNYRKNVIVRRQREKDGKIGYLDFSPFLPLLDKFSM